MSQANSQNHKSIPDSYITDYDKAVDVAYAGKNDRCLAVASRLVDTVLLSNTPECDDSGQTLDERVAITKGLLKVCQLYPEVFSYFNRENVPIDEAKIFNVAHKIIKQNGLPLVDTPYWSTRKRSPEELDNEAETREQIAEALYDHPPSANFMSDYGLLKLRYNNPIDVVLGLKESANYYLSNVEQEERKTVEELELFKKNKMPNSSRMELTLNLLTGVNAALNKHEEGAEFVQEVSTALNCYKTTLADLKDLWLKGRVLIATVYRKKAQAKQQAYDAILSGQAATYQSPKED